MWSPFFMPTFPQVQILHEQKESSVQMSCYLCLCTLYELWEPIVVGQGFEANVQDQNQEYELNNTRLTDPMLR